MMAWLNPVAFALLPLAALPILIHLLFRRRATRIPFPSVRFIMASDRSSVRMRRPTDILLLAVRVAIVATAVLALSRPLWLTNARARALGERTTRAVVVDTSASVDAARAREAAAAETRGAFAARQFEGVDLTTELARAASWLASAEPGRLEIVLVSDFQRGAVEAQSLRQLPAGIGLRTLRVASTGARGTFDAPAVFHEGVVFERSVQATEGFTSVVLRPGKTSAGLDVAADRAAAARIMRAVAVAGALSPSPNQPIRLQFGSAEAQAPRVVWDRNWMFDVARAVFASRPTDGVSLRAAPRDGVLVIDADTPGDALLAADVTQSALNARLDWNAFAEQEPGTLPDAVLDGWTRTPNAPDPSAFRRGNESDGRWLWVMALALLAAETFLRRGRAERVAAVEREAA